MKREFSINLILLIGINLLIKPFYIFGIDRGVQNEVGPEVYGLYFAIFNFTYLFYIINDFGLQNYNNRLIAQNRQQIGRYLPSILGLKIVLSAIYFVAIVSVGYLVGYFPSHQKLLLLIGANQILIALMYYLRGNLSGLGHYRMDSIMSAMDRFLLILICGWLLWLSPMKDEFKIEYFIYAQTASLAITNVILIFLVFPKARKTTLRFNWRTWPSILRNSWPYALAIIMMTLYSRLDSVMIDRLLPDGDYEAGVYASAYRLLDAFNMFGFLMSGLLLPIVSRMIKQQQPIADIFRHALYLMLCLSATIAILGVVFREEIMLWLYVDATLYWGRILGYLLPTFLFSSLGYILATFIIAADKLKRLNRLLIIGVLVNLIMNFVLIPHLKAWGATLSTLATQGIMCYFQWIIVKKHLQVQPPTKDLAKVLGFLVIGILLGLGCYHFLPWIWQINFTLGILSLLLLALGLKLIDPSVITGLLKTKGMAEQE